MPNLVPSIGARLANTVVLPLAGSKRKLSSAARSRRDFIRKAEASQTNPKYQPLRLLTRRVNVKTTVQHGWPVCFVDPKGQPAQRTVVFFHGGAYTAQIMQAHWWFIAGLARHTSTRVIVPIYPLGEIAGAQSVSATATAIAGEAMEQFGADRTVLMGDSAGGAMALVVAQQLAVDHIRPFHLVLLSPWLNAATDGHEQRQLESKDRMLSIAGLQEAARMYAKGLPLSDPLLSPLNGQIAGLPPTTVFSSTADLLKPDSVAFQSACESAGVHCDLHVYAGAPHDFAIMPIREGHSARKIIYSVLESVPSS